MLLSFQENFRSYVDKETVEYIRKKHQTHAKSYVTEEIDSGLTSTAMT